MTSKAQSQRNSAVELLRIIAMFFIVMHHAFVHGGFKPEELPLSINKLYLQFSRLGNLCVIIFILITGYMLCQQRYNFRNLIRLYAQVWFYSILTLLIGCLALGQPLTRSTLIEALFPVIYEKYWFITTYFCLILVVPLLNAAVAALNRSAHLALIGAMLLIWSVIPSLLEQQMSGNEFTQFLMYYLIGAYLRRYPDNILSSRKKRNLLIILCAALYLASVVLINLLSGLHGGFVKYQTHFAGRYSFLMIGLGTGMLAASVCAKPFCNRWINHFGKCSLGVYLLHDSPNIRNTLWQELFANQNHIASPGFIPRMLLCTFAVFAAGMLVDSLRISLLEKPMCRPGYRLYDCLESRLRRLQK